MEWRRATKRKINSAPIDLSQLKEELRRVPGKFEPHKGEFAEGIKQHVLDLQPEVETALPESKNSAGKSSMLAPLLLPLRQETTA